MTITISSRTTRLSAERHALLKGRSAPAGAERVAAVAVMLAGILAAAGTALGAMVSL